MNSKKETIKTQVKASLIKVKKIPVYAGIFLIAFGLIGGIFLIDKGQNYLSQATQGSSPAQIKITNIDSNSFVVSWITEEEVSGKVLYGETNTTLESKEDIRDEEKKFFGRFKTHFFLVDNLKPKTKYYFKIVSGDKTYLQSGKPYELTTAPEKAFPNSDIGQGRVLYPDGTPASGAIVYISLPNAVTQAGFVEENGYWMILLSRTRNSDLQSYLNYDLNTQVEEIFVQAGNQTASAILSTGNDNPTPDITLGQTYDFIKSPVVLAPTAIPEIIDTSAPTGSGFDSVNQSQEVTIAYPAEKEEVNSQTPAFFGTGPKEKILEIIVESEEKIEAETTVDELGRWEWSPSQTLSPGEHKITITYQDQEGFVKKITRSFTVLAVGTSDLPSFTATPSAVLSSPTPTISLIPSQTLSPVPPTKTPTETLLSPTPTEKPVRTTVPSGEVPKSGNSLPTWVFLSGGIILIIAGAAFLLL